MHGSVKAVGAALALSAAALMAAAPAEARPWRGHYSHYHGDRTGAAIGAGIIGLALGAALASPPGRSYYDYDYGYGYGYGYYPPPRRYYYAPPPPPPPPYAWRCAYRYCY